MSSKKINQLELWKSCRHIIDNLSYIDRSGLYTEYIYDDGKLIITAQVEQKFDKVEGTSEYIIELFHVFINKKSELLPALDDEAILIGLEKRNPINGIQREKFEHTQVASVKLVTQNAARLLYYRPGRWQNYLFELSDTIEKFARQHADLHNRSVDDKDLFGNKYKLDDE